LTFVLRNLFYFSVLLTVRGGSGGREA
jgi:hypothetical protein